MNGEVTGVTEALSAIYTAMEDLRDEERGQKYNKIKTEVHLLMYSVVSQDT